MTKGIIEIIFFFEEIAQLNCSPSFVLFLWILWFSHFIVIFFFFPSLGNCTEFFFNDKSVSRSTYISELEKVGILVKVRNCLIFQVSI